MSGQEGIAWAAGFFEGDITFSSAGDYPMLAISGTDPELLRSFVARAKAGKLAGPYDRRDPSRYTKSPLYAVQIYREAASTLASLWPISGLPSGQGWNQRWKGSVCILGNPNYFFRAHGNERVQAILAMLWPWLGTTKRQQATDRLIWKTTCRNGHPKKPGYTDCAECTRAYWAARRSGTAREPAVPYRTEAA